MPKPTKVFGSFVHQMPNGVTHRVPLTAPTLPLLDLHAPTPERVAARLVEIETSTAGTPEAAAWALRCDVIRELMALGDLRGAQRELVALEARYQARERGQKGGKSRKRRTWAEALAAKLVSDRPGLTGADCWAAIPEADQEPLEVYDGTGRRWYVHRDEDERSETLVNGTERARPVEILRAYPADDENAAREGLARSTFLRRYLKTRPI